MRQEEAPIMVFQDGEKAIGRIHQIVDVIYAALIYNFLVPTFTTCMISF